MNLIHVLLRAASAMPRRPPLCASGHRSPAVLRGPSHLSTLEYPGRTFRHRVTLFPHPPTA